MDSRLGKPLRGLFEDLGHMTLGKPHLSLGLSQLPTLGSPSPMLALLRGPFLLGKNKAKLA